MSQLPTKPLLLDVGSKIKSLAMFPFLWTVLTVRILIAQVTIYSLSLRVKTQHRTYMQKTDDPNELLDHALQKIKIDPSPSSLSSD